MGFYGVGPTYTYRKPEIGLDRNHTCLVVKKMNSMLCMVMWYHTLIGYSWYLGGLNRHIEHVRD